jgi:uncharacterized protein involved in response to NO
VLFPAAACYAAVIVPWWALATLGHVPAPAAFALPAGHANEMIFGFGVAVVAGYLLGPQPLRITFMIASAWLVARIAYLGWPGSPFAVLSAAAFAAGFAARVVPRFAVAAKKWRNKIIAPVVCVLAALTAGAAWTGPAAVLGRIVMIEGLLLLSLLMFFMGGRIIAPAIAGHLLRHGHDAEARVQPAIEGAVLIVMFAALLATIVALPGAGVLLLLAAALIVLRILRWRPWRCRGRPDLVMLVLAYAWLPAGLALTGLAFLDARMPLSAGVHAIGVGALGSLTITVMARTRLLYRFRDANASPAAHVATLLVSAAAVVRLVPLLLPVPAPAPLLVPAAALWSAAFLLLLFVLMKTLPDVRYMSITRRSHATHERWRIPGSPPRADG